MPVRVGNPCTVRFLTNLLAGLYRIVTLRIVSSGNTPSTHRAAPLGNATRPYCRIWAGGCYVRHAKNDKERIVTIPRFLTALLEEHLDRFTGTEPDALVFPGGDGEPPRLFTFRRNIRKPALRRAGINDNLRIHDMRHTAASLLINQGLHPKIVQEHLGHHSISLTFDRYGHLYETDTQRLADALDAAYSTGLVARETPQTIPEADTSRTGTPTGATSEQSQPARSRSLQGV
jgi:hypothetical protein